MMKKKPIVATGNSHNSIAAGTVIKGNIIAEEDFRIDGKVEGNIECRGKVVVGPNGEVIGHINCINAELMGKVHGNIRTTEVLLLKGGSEYYGDLSVKVLEIESGAAFNGTCKMGNNNLQGNTVNQADPKNMKTPEKADVAK